jgi:hypothetical protein
MGDMNNLNLLLQFKTAKDAELQVKRAARITIDGRGGVIVHDLQNEVPERISMAHLQALSIQMIR